MRDIIDSALIGGLASFLPFWIWDSRTDQILGAIALSGAIYVFRRWHILHREDSTSAQANRHTHFFIQRFMTTKIRF